MFAHFISADWSAKQAGRSVYVADINGHSISKEDTGDWDLKKLLELANSLRQHGPVLIGVDVVLGVSNGYWSLVLEKIKNDGRNQPKNFVDWLRNIDPHSDFFKTTCEPCEWHVDRPWFCVPSGEGGLRSFTRIVPDDGFRRRIDHETGGNPVFAVSGIPGVVGGATRSFWRELIPILNSNCDRELSVWPFETDLSNLLRQDGIVLCETYPRVAYAIALTDELPTCMLRVSKTKRAERIRACEVLEEANWVKKNDIKLGNLAALINNADDFDAHLTATAFMRCVIERRPRMDEGWTDGIAEGSMLLLGTVDPTQPGRQF